MNQEERRQKRQDEFKHAAVVVTVFVLVLAVMILSLIHISEPTRRS
mgnify:CR=1 FL=1